jgi:tRNA (mo5U34)-methyltransferase
MSLNIDELVADSEEYSRNLTSRKHELMPQGFWYPYGSMNNLSHLSKLLTGVGRDLESLIAGQPVADIGAADGDLSFFLSSRGVQSIDIIDHAPTNFNGLEGARKLQGEFKSDISIHDIDLDMQFHIPRNYGLIIMLGILYHLENPFFVLKNLSFHGKYMLVSTKVAEYSGPGGVRIADIPLGYLLDPLECNDDPTNFWVFSNAGLKRLFSRTGWEIVDFISLGCTNGSEPASLEKDERAFALLRSTR